MRFARPILIDLVTALAYLAAAVAALSLTRFDGGVAFLWVATAVLVPVLVLRRTHRWGWPLLLCGLASLVATGTVGLGWALAVPLAIFNMIEAVLGAWMLRRSRGAGAMLGSLGWFARFILAVGIVAPLVAGLCVATAVSLTGRPFGTTFMHFFTGHALGSLAFIPVVTLLANGDARRLLTSINRRQTIELLAVLSAVAGATFFAFSSDDRPLLFLPFGPIIFAIFRGRQLGAALSVVLLAVIGGGLTIAGRGPINLIDADMGSRLIFFQFYLASCVVTVLPVAADLRNRARLHRELRFSEERFRLLAEQVSDVIMHLNLDGTIRYVSPSIEAVGGYDHRSLVGTQSSAMIVPEDIEHVRACHAKTLEAAGETLVFEYRGRLVDGQERWFETRSRALIGRHGEIEGVVSVLNDVSRRKAVEARLTEEAMTDPLTGLPNRRAFRAAAGEAIRSGRACWIAVIDLDHFKRVNDTYGHDGGDAVLQHFGWLARGLVRKDDVVARLGGEEFALLLHGEARNGAIEVVERLRSDMASSVTEFDGQQIRVTISAGLARLDADGIDEALKRADLALYRAKESGRDQLALAA